MSLQVLLQRILFAFGIGFLIANILIIVDLIRFSIRKRSALLVWQGEKPRLYGFSLALGVMLGLLFVFKLFVQHRPIQTLLGESMMFVYYACLTPLSTRIGRGFYQDGIWADTSFIPYNEVGGLTWREGEHQVTLIVISRLRNLARRLIVPLENYGAARRLLRDKIAAHDIHFSGTGLDLGNRDERDQA